jgi:hypothetical protein
VRAPSIDAFIYFVIGVREKISTHINIHSSTTFIHQQHSFSKQQQQYSFINNNIHSSTTFIQQATAKQTRRSICNNTAANNLTHSIAPRSDIEHGLCHALHSQDLRADSLALAPSRPGSAPMLPRVPQTRRQLCQARQGGTEKC